ncbi:MAG: hypothetical protein KBH93_13785, partial [Anaerolineae bacterium]|nr:hypothetical protein [Anaerolineae bacterium]
SDVLIDLHTSSPGTDMPLFVGCLDDGSPASSRAVELALATAMPVLWTHPDLGPGRTLTTARDLDIPALYAMFLGASLAWLLDRNRLSSAWDVVLVLPIAAALCDLAENASHVAFLVDDANVTTAWVAVSGAAAIAKWLLAGSSIVLIVILALRTRLVAGRAVA